MRPSPTARPPSPSPSATPSPSPLPPPDALAAQQADLIEAVEAVRELETRAEVPFERMTRAALRAQLEEEIAQEVVPEEVRAEDQMLKLLGLIPAETDLLALSLDLYESQIAGFYDPEAATFYLVSEERSGESLSLLDQITFVHEYVHALQDQHFNLERLSGEEAAETLTHDQSRAAQALIEGDAQWATVRYLIQYVSAEQLAELAEEASEVDDETLARTPAFLRDSLTFPYEQGLAFVQATQLAEGWDDIAAIWHNPPVSTEQILHPEKYPADVPTDVTLPEGVAATMGEGWTEPLRDVWGEYDLLLLLRQQPLGSAPAARAAAGWDGDQYLFVTRGEQGVFVLESAWDSPQDRTEARIALLEWLRASGYAPVGADRLAAGGRAAFLRPSANRLRLAIATDEGGLAAALAALGWE